LLIMCIEHSAQYHTELQTRQLLIKMSNAIQTVASVSLTSFVRKQFHFTYAHND